LYRPDRPPTSHDNTAHYNIDGPKIAIYQCNFTKMGYSVSDECGKSFQDAANLELVLYKMGTQVADDVTRASPAGVAVF